MRKKAAKHITLQTLTVMIPSHPLTGIINLKNKSKTEKPKIQTFVRIENQPYNPLEIKTFVELK